MGVQEERAEEHRAEIAIDFPEGLPLGNRPGSIWGKGKIPAGVVRLRRDGLDGSRNRIVASAPRACTEPTGRFHRGATRGELDSTSSGVVEDANTYP